MNLDTLRTFGIDWSTTRGTCTYVMWDDAEKELAETTHPTDDVYLLGDAVTSRVFPTLTENWHGDVADFSRPSASKLSQNTRLRFSPVSRFGVMVDFEEHGAASVSMVPPWKPTVIGKLYRTLATVLKLDLDTPSSSTAAGVWTLVDGPSRFSVRVTNGYSREVRSPNVMLQLEFLDLGDIAQKLSVEFDSPATSGGLTLTTISARRRAGTKTLRYHFPEKPTNPTLAMFSVHWDDAEEKMHFQLRHVAFMLSDSTSARLMPGKALFRVEAQL